MECAWVISEPKRRRMAAAYSKQAAAKVTARRRLIASKRSYRIGRRLWPCTWLRAFSGRGALTTFKIQHRTTYRYREQVSLGPHRLMFRPRENRDLRLITSEVTLTPKGALTRAQDVFGNAVATASFQTMTDMLVIDSAVELQLNAAPWPVFDIAASAIVYPFQYSGDEAIDLGALATQQYPDPAGQLRAWSRAFVRGASTDTLSLLKDLCGGVSKWINYQSREDEGTQSPCQTGPRLGILPGFRGPFRRGGAQSRFRGAGSRVCPMHSWG